MFTNPHLKPRTSNRLQLLQNLSIWDFLKAPAIPVLQTGTKDYNVKQYCQMVCLPAGNVYFITGYKRSHPQFCEEAVSVLCIRVL